MDESFQLNSSSVDNGLKIIEGVSPLLAKISNNVSLAESTLDKTLGVNDFGNINDGVTSCDGDFNTIYNLCNTFIDECDELEKTMGGISFDSSENEDGLASIWSGLSEDGNLTPEELEKLSLMLSLFSDDELSNDDMRSLINSDMYSNYLTQEDLDYLNKQLNLGNTRAANQYLIVKVSERNLKLLEDENNDKITTINAELDNFPAYPYNGVSYHDYDVLYTYCIDNDPEFASELKSYYDKGDSFGLAACVVRKKSGLLSQITELKNEITAQKRTVNMYKNSNKEWEYDYVFNMIGTDEFEETITPYYFFSGAREFYSDKIPGDLINNTDIFINMLAINNDDNSYIGWLKSDECTLENKEQLISYYENNIEWKQTQDIKKNLNQLVGDNISSDGWSALGFGNDNGLLDDERKVYAYTLLTSGNDGCKDFLSSFEQTINMRSGIQLANDKFWDIVSGSENGTGALSSFVDGTEIGLNNWFDRVGQIFSDTGVQTKEEYAILYLNQMLSGVSYLADVDPESLDKLNLSDKVKNEITEKINSGEEIKYLDIALMTNSITQAEYDSFNELTKDERVNAFLERNSEAGLFGISHIDWLQKTFNAGVSAGTMIPSIALTAATNGVLGNTALTAKAVEKISGLVAMGSMFVYEYSSDKAESIRNGVDVGLAQLHAFLSASGESVTERIIGGVPVVSKGAKWFKITADDKKITKIAKTLLNWIVIDPAKEITQEELQDNVYEPLVDIFTYGSTDHKITIDGLIDTALTTYISTFVMQGGNVATSLSLNSLGTAYNKLNSNTVIRTVNIGEETYDLTLSELLHCFDIKTLSISQDKVEQVLSEKIVSTIYEKSDGDIAQFNAKVEQLSGGSSLIAFVKNIVEQSNQGNENATKLNEIIYSNMGNSGFVNILSQIGNMDIFTESTDNIWYTTDDIRFESVSNLVQHLSTIDSVVAIQALNFLNSKELQGYYERAYNERTPGENGSANLDTFRTHGLGHAIEVLMGCTDSYNGMVKINPSLSNTPLLLILTAAGIAHDTGMARGYYLKAVTNENGDLEFNWIENNAETTDENGNKVPQDIGNRTRNAHSSMSGLDILQMSDVLQGIFPETDIALVALCAFAHSKSNSGIKTLSNNASWSCGVNNFEALIKEYNKTAKNKITFEITPESGTAVTESLVEYLKSKGYIVSDGSTTAYKFSDDVTGNLNTYNFSSDFIEIMGNAGLALRLGDANTNNAVLGTNQYGKKIKIVEGKANEVPSINDYMSQKSEDDFGKALRKRAGAELEGTWYELDGKPGNAGSNQFVVGESNQNYRVLVETDKNGNLYFCETIDVADANYAPAATIFAANERQGEINSAGSLMPGQKKFVINLTGEVNKYTRELYIDYINEVNARFNDVDHELRINGEVVAKRGNKN